jgi:nitrate reductase beta subunit
LQVCVCVGHKCGVSCHPTYTNRMGVFSAK